MQNSPHPSGKDTQTFRNHRFLREESLREAAVLLLLAGKLIDPPDGPLPSTQAKALLLIAQEPAITIGKLQHLLFITRQGLHQTLQALKDEALIEFQPNPKDLRQRQLSLTEKGEAKQRALAEDYRKKIFAAFQEAGPEAVEGFRKVMLRLAGGG